MIRSTKLMSTCKVCDGHAVYSYYGATACESCKIFFKRNAENRQKILNCYFNGQCEINVAKRLMCSACRLQKCFTVGMSADKIRGSYAKNKQKMSSTTTISGKSQSIKKLPTLNLLDQDQSLLSKDEWNLLSNLIHSYDEHNALVAAKEFTKELNSLHPKLRFKIDSTKIIEIVTVLSQTAEPFIQSNGHFNRLCHQDRSIVLYSAVDNVICLGTALIFRQSGLITNSAFRNGLEITYGPDLFNLSLQMVSLLDQDVDLVKLTLSMFVFSTDTLLKDLINFPSISHIQNMYAELIWKYLLYKYKFQQAVIRFSHLIKCITIAVTIRVHLQNLKNHTDMIESVVQKIENQQINMTDN